MTIRIVNYQASRSPTVQAFVDIEIDGWLRFNGLNFLRDGSLKSAQLTPLRYGRKLYFNAVEILDCDLAKLVAADIVAAIEKHIALLPKERRMRPPISPKPAAAQNTPAKPPQESARSFPAPAAKNAGRQKPLPPPARLLARRGGPLLGAAK